MLMLIRYSDNTGASTALRLTRAGTGASAESAARRATCQSGAP